MSISYILFDLDGTLLPMDQDAFVNDYFTRLAAFMAPHGYDPKKLMEAIWGGTTAMIKNCGNATNEQVFWDCFATLFGADSRKDEPIFDDFYRTEFQNVRSACGFQPKSAGLIEELKQRGYTVVLATNPIFPAIATESRIRWAGLNRSDFTICTTYENSRFCKPNPDYYRDILAELGAAPEECIMVGNDVTEDMIARELGMQVFLLTDCIINRHEKDISCYPHGNFDALMAYLQAI